MLRVDLGRLAREGSVLLEEEIPADAALWEGSGIEWEGPVDVRVRATYAGTGEIVGRGSLSGRLRQQCRRCLEPVVGDFDLELTMVFVTDESEAEAAESGTFLLDPAGNHLDMQDAVREEVILALNPYVVCDPECPGLCPKCGKDLKEGPCDCTTDEPDPRWDALRELEKG